MFKFNPTMAIVGFALLIGSFGYGYMKGSARQVRLQERARVVLQEELLDLRQSLDVKAAHLRRLTEERRGLIDELESEAYSANGAAAPGVGSIDGLQRLKRRWGSGGQAPY